MRVLSTHKLFFTHTTNGFWTNKHSNQNPPFNDGSLGSSNDEERRETRYVMWIAGLSESSNLWTQIATRTLWVWVYLVQTRSPTAVCFIEDAGSCSLKHLFKNCRRPVRFRTDTLLRCIGWFVLAKISGATPSTHAPSTNPHGRYFAHNKPELNSGKRTRWI